MKKQISTKRSIGEPAVLSAVVMARGINSYRSSFIGSFMENNRIEYKRELADGLKKEVVTFLNAREGSAHE